MVLKYYILTLAICACVLMPQCLPGQTNSFDFLTNGLAAYYPFNGNAKDESGYHRDGTNIQSELTMDRFGRTNAAYTVGGTSKGFILLPEDVGISGSSNLTVSLWFKTSNSGNEGGSRNLFTRFNWIITGGVPSAPLVTDIELNNINQLYLNIDYNATWTTNLTLNTDAWYHVAFSLSGNEPDATRRMRIFVNGELQQIVASYCPDHISVTGSKSITAIGALVGQNQNSANNFDGSIDDVRIYSRTLTAEEIANLYAYESVARPSVSIAVKSVRVTMLVEPGKSYQLETSSDLKTWMTNGIPFTAAAPQLDQDFDVTNAQRYFRLVEVP